GRPCRPRCLIIRRDGRAARRRAVACPDPPGTIATATRADASRSGMPVYGSIGEFLQATIALIAIANPIAALPVFLSLVATDDPRARRAAASRVAVATFAILAGAVLVGRLVLGLFGISFAAFRVGRGRGGALTGLHMLG